MWRRTDGYFLCLQHYYLQHLADAFSFQTSLYLILVHLNQRSDVFLVCCHTDLKKTAFKMAAFFTLHSDSYPKTNVHELTKNSIWTPSCIDARPQTYSWQHHEDTHTHAHTHKLSSRECCRNSSSQKLASLVVLCHLKQKTSLLRRV